MSGNLLDTNIVIFALDETARLTKPVRRAISAGPNYISIAAYWEVTIKSMRGKLKADATWWERALYQLAASPLLVNAPHVSALTTLPRIHGDPFDRIQIAQATHERLTFLTADQVVAQYATANLRVIR